MYCLIISGAEKLRRSLADTSVEFCIRLRSGVRATSRLGRCAPNAVHTCGRGDDAGCWQEASFPFLMDLPKGLLTFPTEDESHAPPFAVSYYLGEPYPMWERNLTVMVATP